jgi:iron complex transport system substrate-binding protein
VTASAGILSTRASKFNCLPVIVNRLPEFLVPISIRIVLTLALLPLFNGSASAENFVAVPAVAPPQRIVSLVPALTETLFALGVGGRLVGVSDYCDAPEAARTLPRVGTFVAPVAEAVLVLEPDLVLTSPTPGNERAVRALERSGVRIGLVGGDASIEEVRAAIARTAALVGAEVAGRQLLARIDGELEAVRRAAADLDRPEVALVIGSDPLVLAGAPSYLGELLELVGADTLGARLQGRWPRVGLEFLVSASPRVLIDVSSPMEEGKGAAAARARWARFPSIAAVAAGRVHALEASVLLRPGPRLGEAARLLFETVHGREIPGELSGWGAPWRSRRRG